MSFYILTTPDRDNFEYILGVTDKSSTEELDGYSEKLNHPFFKMFIECTNSLEVFNHLKTKFVNEITSNNWCTTELNLLVSEILPLVKLPPIKKYSLEFPGVLKPIKQDGFIFEHTYSYYEVPLNEPEPGDEEIEYYEDLVDEDISDEYLHKLHHQIGCNHNGLVVAQVNNRVVIGYRYKYIDWDYDICFPYIDHYDYKVYNCRKYNCSKYNKELDIEGVKPYIINDIRHCLMSIIHDGFLWPPKSGPFMRERETNERITHQKSVHETLRWFLTGASFNDKFIRFIVPSFMTQPTSEFKNIDIAKSYNSYDCDSDGPADRNKYYIFCYCNLYADNAANLIKAINMLNINKSLEVFNEISLYPSKFRHILEHLDTFQGSDKVKLTPGVLCYGEELMTKDEILEILRNLKPRHWQRQSSFITMGENKYIGDKMYIQDNELFDGEYTKVSYFNPMKCNDVDGCAADHCTVKEYKPRIGVWCYG